jgi:hypothetical protein
MNHDPVVLFDPVSGPVTDSQLRAICEKAKHDRGTRDKIDKSVSSRQFKLKARLNTWLDGNPSHPIATDLRELIEHLDNWQDDYNYWKNKGDLFGLSIAHQRVIVGNVYSLTLAVMKIAETGNISQADIINDLGRVAEDRVQQLADEEVRATIENLEARITVIIKA